MTNSNNNLVYDIIDARYFLSFFRLFAYLKTILSLSSFIVKHTFFKFIGYCIFAYSECLHNFLLTDVSFIERTHNLDSSFIVKFLLENYLGVIGSFKLLFDSIMNNVIKFELNAIFELNVFVRNNKDCVFFLTFILEEGYMLNKISSSPHSHFFLNHLNHSTFFNSNLCLIRENVFRNQLLQEVITLLNFFFGVSFDISVKNGFFYKGYLYIPHYLACLSKFKSSNLSLSYLFYYYYKAAYVYAGCYFFYMDFCSNFTNEGLVEIVDKYILNNDFLFIDTKNATKDASLLLHERFFQVIERLIYLLHIKWYLKKFI